MGRSKGLPAHRVGRLLRFRLSEVNKWVKTSSGSHSETRKSSKMKGSAVEKRPKQES